MVDSKTEFPFYYKLGGYYLILLLIKILCHTLFIIHTKIEIDFLLRSE